MNTPDIHCSECGDTVSLTVARIDESSEFATDTKDFRYLCPVCAIQAKNTRMQEKMLQELSARN
ncbi:MAG: hypothetical protein U1F27_11285 [Turneriella sp.]